MLHTVATSGDLYNGAVEPRRTWPTTGWWRQYYGNVEEIVRTTLANALQIALGVTPQSERPTRRLQLEIFWKCGQTWFEGWLTWNVPPAAPTVGQITVIFTTPGIGSNVLTRAAGGGNLSPELYRTHPTGGPIPPIDPEGSYPRRGMWLVTHQLNMLLPPVPSTSATASGKWIVPAIGPSYAGVGKIEPIAPHFENGGIPEERRAETESDPTSKTAPDTPSGRTTS